MSAEIIRLTIFSVVWAVLVLRTPFMLRDKHQRPLWLVLAVIAVGSILIQSWLGTAVNSLSGIPQLNNLLQGLFGVLDIAVTLEFVVHLVGGGSASRRTRLMCALVTAVGMSVFFVLTPASLQFKPITTPSPFIGYVFLVAVYLAGGAGVAAWLMGRHLTQVKNRVLYVGVLMVTVGNAAEVPFMGLRTLQRFALYSTPEMLQVTFLLSTARFVLVPLGCALAAMEPVVRAALYYYRRVRLYSLWRLLRSATPELVLGRPAGRWRDLLTFDDAWERLHRRVIEIRDSILYLHEARASQELIDAVEAQSEAVRTRGPRDVVKIACWLEVARRDAVAELPKVHRDAARALLPELRAEKSTMRTETAYLLELRHALGSSFVRDFADRFVQGAPAHR